MIPQEELAEVLWGDSSSEGNSFGALKTLLYRSRSVLDQLWSGAGRDLILTGQNGYSWNPECEVLLDCEEFDGLNSFSEGITAENLDRAVSLLNLYRGAFLGKFSSEFWVMPLAEYYHQIYIRSLLAAIPFLREEKRYDEIADFVRLAVSLEPFHEELHCALMYTYLALDKKDLAVEVYQKFSERLMSELGVMPSEEIRAAYHEATKKGTKGLLTASSLKEQLREQNGLPGALVCDFAFFCVLYHSMARSVLRSGIAVHMVLISVNEKKGEFTEKKRKKVMEKLGEVLRCSLRRGDTASLCSTSQYVVMLPRANYENSCMVCDRILKAWEQKDPRSDCGLNFEVFPLQPDEMERFS